MSLNHHWQNCALFFRAENHGTIDRVDLSVPGSLPLIGAHYGRQVAAYLDYPVIAYSHGLDLESIMTGINGMYPTFDKICFGSGPKGVKLLLQVRGGWFFSLVKGQWGGQGDIAHKERTTNKLLKAIFLGHDGNQVQMIVIGHAQNGTGMVPLFLAKHPHPFVLKGITFNLSN
uniref:Uncharacterized protein n=1 Tax=Desulfobacca acetoxidans TaxID=60893 RepID=A0A7V4G9G9_9BACT